MNKLTTFKDIIDIKKVIGIKLSIINLRVYIKWKIPWEKQFTKSDRINRKYDWSLSYFLKCMLLNTSPQRKFQA